MQSSPSYSALPKQQSMAPAHQSLFDPRGGRYSIPRKPVSTQSWGSQKTARISEHEVGRTLDDERSTHEEHSTEDGLGQLWRMELLSLIVAFVAFVAIIITLLLHQNRPLPKWPSLISINTLVAIFTAVMKASMLFPVAEGISQLKWLWFRDSRPLIDLDRFDSASRGPWGCILLVVRRHTSRLALLGALVTIVAMAIDPFAQQVIQYDYCSTTARDTAALIPRTNNYTAGFRATNGGAGHSSGAMNAAFFGQGLFDPPLNASFNIRTTCPTGNCTFPATSEGVSYMSLGMCSSCTDITDEITNTTTNVTDSEGNLFTTFVNYVLPSNLTVSPLGEHLVAATLVLTPQESPVEKMVSQSMITFEMLMMDTNMCADAPELSGCKVWASRCSLTPCVKSYSATISDGILYERELSSIPLQSLPAPAGNAYFSIFTNTTVVDGHVGDCTPTNTPTERNTLRMGLGSTWLSASYFQNASTAPYYPPECAFTLGVGATDGLAGSLFSTYADQNITDVLGEYSAQPWMLQLFNNGTATPDSLNTAISGLANAITAAIRNGGDAVNSAPAAGSVILSQTCIRVRWAWLSLPASMLGLASLFLAGTIGQTAADGTGRAWKSSVLALLFHGFDGAAVREVGGLREMNETAGKMRARLGWGKGMWRFVDVAEGEEGECTDVQRVVKAPVPVDGDGWRSRAGVYYPPPPRQDGRKA